MRATRTWVLLALAAGTLAAPLAAQQEYNPPKIELSPFGGVLTGKTLYKTAAGQPVSATTKGTLGVRLTWNVSPQFGLEASWARAVPTLLTPNATLPGTPAKVGTVTINQYDLSALFSFASPREALVFSVGGGVARLAPDFTGATAGTDTRPLLTVGLGYRRFFAGHFGLRTDLRFHGIATSRATDIGILCGGTTGCYVYQDRKFYSSWEFTGGLVIRF
jgi:hypothetical protein